MEIVERLIDMANKWRDANRDVYDVCRDGAEEVRVLQKENELLKKQIDIYEEWSKPKFIPYDKSTSITLGWGKDKDE